VATELARDRFVRWQLEELLVRYPGLRLVAGPVGFVRLAGVLAFTAAATAREEIADEYHIEMDVPDSFPADLPSVKETRGRIPPDFHKLQGGALCLGSPTRLLLIARESGTLPRFVDRCVVPYLYGYSYFEKLGTMPFGELEHGAMGIRNDFASLFGVTGPEAGAEFVRLTAMRRRQANKQPCPCGSLRRLGRCHNRRVNDLRNRLGRNWFRMWHAAFRASRVNANRHLAESGVLPADAAGHDPSFAVESAIAR
jgi:hypothetical protein